MASKKQAEIKLSLSAADGCRNFVLGSGDLLLFKYVVSELEQDLQCRLKVFFKVTNKELTAKKHALLQNSQLWRTFSVSWQFYVISYAQARACHSQQVP